MTLTELELLYNFHDCDVSIPFSVIQDNIILTFELAKHMQYHDFKAKHIDLIENDDYALLVTIKFLNCTSIKASEWFYDYSNGERPKRLNEKNIIPEQVDQEMLLYTCSMSDKDGAYLLFTKDPDKGTEITFFCEEAEIVEEKFVLVKN